MLRSLAIGLFISFLAISFAFAQTATTPADPWAEAQELTRQGDFARAIPLLQKATLDTTNLAAALQLAYARQRTGAWATAKRDYETLLRRRPRLAEALNQLALLSEREANYAKALRLYRRLLEGDSLNAYFLKQTGAQLSRLNQPAAAVPFYRKALRINPEDLEALGELARIYLDDGRHDKLAAPLLDRGLRLDSTSVKLLQLDSRLNYRLGAFAGVVSDLEKTMALGDTTAYYQRLLGTAYYQLDSLAKSVRTFERLLRLGEDTEAVHAGLATAFLLGMKPLPKDSNRITVGAAQMHFRLAIERGTSPRIPDYLISQAEAMELDGFPSDHVARQYREVYQKYNRPKALYRLGLLFEKKDPELARVYYREFLDICKKKPKTAGLDLVYVGTVQARLNALRKATGKPAAPASVVAKDTLKATPDTTGNE